MLLAQVDLSCHAVLSRSMALRVVIILTLVDGSAAWPLAARGRVRAKWPQVYLTAIINLLPKQTQTETLSPLGHLTSLNPPALCLPAGLAYR